MMVTRILAHQGGWDETLIFIVVVAVGLFVLRSAERKARLRAGAPEEADETVEGNQGTGGPGPDRPTPDQPTEAPDAR